MISYDRLWETMRQKGATTYTLQVKGGISSSTIRRMKAKESVAPHTIDALCKILNCTVNDVIEYMPDSKEQG
ncbi:MAG: helix-turn-helix transcriptional regulator [Lachnospiraceae bacterium]|nr:helix-turn-helix transcriptional regulator [Lachnospiraceae bacterium]